MNLIFLNKIITLYKKYPKVANYLLLPFLYAIFGTLATLPFGYWPLGLLMPITFFIPLYYLTTQQKFTFRNILLLSLSFGIIGTCFINFWLFDTIKIYGSLQNILAFPIFILYGALTSSKFFIFYFLIYLYYRYKKNQNQKLFPIDSSQTLKDPLYYSIAWVIAERLGWYLYPHFGATFIANNNTMVQIVDLIGVLGLSFFWLLWGYTIYILFIQLFNKKYPLQKKLQYSKKLYYATGITFILIYIYGLLIPIYWNKQNTNEYHQYAVIQGNIDLRISNKQSRTEFTKEAIDTMYDLSYNLLEKEKQNQSKIDLVIWPEGSIPFSSYQRNYYLRNATRSLTKEFNTSLIINDIFIKKKKKQRAYYSRLLLINPNEPILERNQYHKNYLLPFGEYIPFSGSFPLISKIFPAVSNFSKGELFQLISLKSGISVLPTICYETTSTEFIQKFFKRTNSKANLIINLTNDKWFGKTLEPYQHLDITRLRSIELRKPMIRSTNSGISTYIDIFGNLHEPTKIFQQNTIKYSIPVFTGNTFYSKFGNLPLYVFCIILILLYIILEIRIRQIPKN